jgi:hypothetical protein
VLGHNQKTWRCFICEVVHEGERGNEASIPAAVQRTIEALQAVVHDMSTRLTGC